MVKMFPSGITNLILLGILASRTVTVVATDPESLSRREERIPWIDYAGIELAATEAIDNVLQRRNLAESTLGPVNRRDYSPEMPVCKKIQKRKEWRQLSRKEKKEYTRAIKCLQTKGNYGVAPVSNNTSHTLYDAFTEVHTYHFEDFHVNSNFLPWHRWIVWLHAEAMAQECGYTGPSPFWNYTMDYKNPTGSPIFSKDPETGFGTHGTIVRDEIGLGGYQVDNGAFANLKVNVPIPHYLTRNFSYWKDIDPAGTWGYQLGKAYSPKQVEILMTAPTFWDFEVTVDALNVTGNFGIHNAPHYFSTYFHSRVNGTEFFPFGVASTNDPMFWPHHQYVDHLWWNWQQKPGKQWEFNGYKSTDWLRAGDPPPEEHAQSTDILPFHGLGPSVPVALALKTENWPLCYTY